MYDNELIDGKENEVQFVNYLNGKMVKDVHLMFQQILENIFIDICRDDIIYAWKNDNPQKTDIYIKIKDIIKRVSIKKGIKNSIHMEPISEFIHFIIENGISKESVLEYLKYQYADGTTNGTGKVRQSVSEYKVDHQEVIDKINLEFNQTDILYKAINRFVFQGRNDNNEIDLIIYGIVNNFIWITKDEIKQIIINQKDVYSTGVHFGPLFCQPLARCLNYNPRYEYGRFCVQIKWYNIFDDILKVMNNRN